jgi:intein/homing endonuclease
VKLEEVTKEQRDFAKRLNFGVVYGIGARRFALLTGLKETEAEDLLRRYFATYRDLDAWLREAGNKAVRERTAHRTVAGRLFRFNFDPEDRQASSLAHRGGKNSPIQGCVRKGTRILTLEHGYAPIEEAAHQAVTVWDGREFVAATVAPSGRKRLVRLELWGGHYIECSPDHRFWTIDANGRGRWLSAEGLAEIKQIYVDITGPVPDWELPFDLQVFEPKDLKLNYQPVAKPHNAKTLSLEAFSDRFSLGLWTGRLASDGSVSSLATKRPGNVVLMVAEHEEAILPEMEMLTGTFGYFGKRTRVTRTQPGAFHSLTVGSISLTKQLLHYGIKERVPDFLWKSKSALRGYLRGMFDGDGTVNKDGPILTFGKGPDQHLGWARQIQEALLLFGVRSRINRCADRINVRALKRDTHRFAEQIGFMNPAKQAKLAAVTPRAYVEDSGIYGRAVRVKSVEITNESVEMYDVVNSASGRFMANGMVTHNSSADIIKRAMRLLHDRLKGTGAAIVNVVHDEIVVECPAADADAMALVVKEEMKRAGEEYVKAVPVNVEAAVTDEWVK